MLQIGEHNDAKIIAWSKVVDHPLQTHDPKTWLLQLAMFWVVLTTVPQVLWIYPHVPLPYCPAPGWLRACFIFIGFTVLVVMWVVMLWFLPRQLKLTGFRRLNSILVPLAVAPTMRSRSQTLDVMLTAGSTATDAQFESAALEAGAQLQQAAKDEREFAFSTGNAYKSGIMYFVSVLLMLEWILICSQVLYSKVEQRVCNAA